MSELSVTGIDALVSQLEKRKDSLHDRITKPVVYAVADSIMDKAEPQYAEEMAHTTSNITMYSHTQDASAEVVAMGEEVMFIEFGTGVKYPDDHPKQGQVNGLVGRGEFGKGRGANPKGWHFTDKHHFDDRYDEPSLKARTAYHTYGRPAAKIMYNSFEDTRNELADLAKEAIKHGGK